MSLLALRDFRLVWSASIVSLVGDGLAFIAFMWLAYDVGGAGGVIVVRLVDSVPSVLIGLGAGVLADRIERRRLMVAADLIRAATLAGLALVVLVDEPSVPMLAAGMFLLRVGDSVFEPAAAAMLPDIVPENLIQRANALFNAVHEGLWAFSMAAAGLLLVVVPLEHFFTIDAASFLLSAVVIALVRTRSRGEPGEHHPLAELFAGVSELICHRRLGIATIVFGLGVVIGAGIFIPAAPVLVGAELEAGPGTYGLVLLGFGIGAIAAAAVLARVEVQRRELWSIVSWVGYAVCFVLMALSPSLPLLMIAAAAAGAAESGARILLVSAMQHQIGTATLGRAMAVFYTVHRAAHGVGLVTVAFLVTALPVAQALAIGVGLDLLMIAAGVITLRLWQHRVAAAVGGG